MPNVPRVFLTVNDYRRFADTNLLKSARDYYESGAEEEKTLRRNEAAFNDFLVRPRCLRSVQNVDTRTEWNGTSVPYPIGIAPTAFQRMATSDGELSTVRAAAATSSIMICSSWSTTSIEDIGKEAKQCGATIWFQLYVYRDRSVTEALINRAEKSGAKALVLTVDTPVLGRRIADTINGFTLPNHLKFANFDTGASQANMPKGESGKSGFMEYVCSQIDPSLDWTTLRWIKTKTSLPIIVKGVMRGDDAELALNAKVDGIIVSNHGGRQMDGTISTIEALPNVLAAVGGKIPVYLDGGIRTGRDIFKAVGIGAAGIFVGRPILWGLATDGTRGATGVLDVLQSEFKHCMQLSGFRSIKELQADKGTIVHASKIAKI
ncbi:unnamed protein product [Caenorhabditis bovis]|uniref:FMN hydroxy acid dehydrogenase domain-containing protein n=1 Tax=Caenorhabditis bovis TaxID=2654633 RepID=A0A8S1E414_9PELO|nr:unnamed protein product [Caenorhabditis bovis]